MLVQTVAPFLAFVAAASAHPYNRVSGDHRPWRSWPNNSSSPIGSPGPSGYRPNSQATSAIQLPTSSQAIGTTTVEQTTTVSLLRVAELSATSASDLCAPLTTTTTVIVYETVTAATVSPAVPSAETPASPVAIKTRISSPARPASSTSTPSAAVVVTSSGDDVSSGSSPATTTAAQAASPAVAATSQTEAPISTAPSSGSKRGIIANPIPKVVAPFSKYEKISWDMNWWHEPPPGQPENWQFVPQLTHPQPDQWWPDADFRHNVSEFPYIASFLEPNGPVSIEEAVQSWKAHLEPLASTHTLIPPMVGQNGLSWLQNFTAACTGCTLDKGPIAFTVYASPDEGGVADFKHHISQFEAAYPGRELWAANIGPLGAANDSATEWLMRQLVPYLDSEPAVTRYAWNGDKSFWDDSTESLTPLAQLYATL